MAAAEVSTYSALLRALSEERFSAVLGHSPRQAKEGYFARHHIRAPKSSASLLTPGLKNQQRISGLRQVFVRGDDDALAEEILRRFLLSHRNMLIVVLDTLGIAHEDGLTESEELGQLADLSAAKRRELIDAIAAHKAASAEDAALYLDFMALETRKQV